MSRRRFLALSTGAAGAVGVAAAEQSKVATLIRAGLARPKVGYTFDITYIHVIIL